MNDAPVSIDRGKSWRGSPLQLQLAQIVILDQASTAFFVCRRGSTAAGLLEVESTWRGAIRERTRTGLAGAKALLCVSRQFH